MSREMAYIYYKMMCEGTENTRTRLETERYV